MAAAAIPLLAAGAGAAVGAFAGGVGKKKQKTPTVPDLPIAPDPRDASKEQEAALSVKKGKARIPGTVAGRAGTLLTGSSGLTDSAPILRKTLLGS